jgi:hypothetical protein
MPLQGYIKLWRKSINSGLIKNHNVWIFWTWCLLKANHQPDFKQVVGFQEVLLQPGQFIFGLKKASEETGLSIQKIRTCIKFLEKYQNLTYKPTNKFSVISIINWSIYQGSDKENNNQSNKHVTSRQQAGNNKQEHKNIRTKESTLKGTGTKKPKKRVFVPPTIEETIQFFIENGFSEASARKAHAYYQDNNWKDSRDNPVKNWKQKMRGVWFKDENLTGNDKHNNFKEREYVGTPNDEISWIQD